MDYPYLNQPRDGYVFIVTYGRSGSTLLQNLLNSIDGYCIRGENNNALAYLAACWNDLCQAEPVRGLWNAGLVTDEAHPWYGAEKISRDRLGRSLTDAFVRDVLNLPEGTRVGGFKEIRFHNSAEQFEPFLNFIHRFFPNSRFIFNTRDHTATTRSGWWANQDPEKVRQVLTEAEALYAAYLAKYPNRCILLRYDDYVADPSQLEPLFAFLGESYDPALVDRVLNTRLDHLKKVADRR